MAVYTPPVQTLIDELGRLPGVGPKSAQRIAFHLLKLSKDDALRLARSLTEVKDRMGSLAGQLSNLSKTWRDQEHKKFADEFEQHMKIIARFLDITDQHIPYLLRKAETIEQYLQQR